MFETHPCVKQTSEKKVEGIEKLAKTILVANTCAEANTQKTLRARISSMLFSCFISFVLSPRRVLRRL